MRELVKSLKGLEEKRTSYILELGEIKYREIRKAGVDQEKLEKILEDLILTDKEIFKVKESIRKLEEEREGLKCPSCNELVSPDDKFCNSCGSDLDFSEEDKDLVECKVCSNLIEEDYNYCNACGSKI